MFNICLPTYFLAIFSVTLNESQQFFLNACVTSYQIELSEEPCSEQKIAAAFCSSCRKGYFLIQLRFIYSFTLNILYISISCLAV